jgi:hypothetical protein
VNRVSIGAAFVIAAAVLASSCSRQPSVAPEEARAIAREAYIWAYPMVENYRVMYVHSVYKAPDNPEYKAPFNVISNTARVFTPADSTVQTPNSDTPYSTIFLDLRAEPVVITVPKIEAGRYYSLQLIDLYTFNFAYIGTRATGNDGGNYLIAGPGWKGTAPAGVSRVIPCETEFALVAIRTQLFGPDDLENVKAVQAGYASQPLSRFAGTETPKGPEGMIFPPYSRQNAASAKFFSYVNFLLPFCPEHPSETGLRARMATLGIKPGRVFDTSTMNKDLLAAIEAGIADGRAAIDSVVMAGDVFSGASFGTREFLQNDYLKRAAAAKAGLYGNSREEAVYPSYRTDSAGMQLTGRHAYTLRFEPDGLPPVDAFWSVTVYDGIRQTLVENPLNRYLINSPMLPGLARDKDGGLTILIQRDSPGKAKESNWLPAPEGPFYVVMRLYLPKPEVLDGTWKEPPMVRIGE